jgi:hypothetical protein
MQQVQTTFQKDCKLKKPYSLGPYSKIKGNKQAIRITEGCVWNCPNCHEPTEIKIFGIPKIERNEVLIFDMNLLCKPEALEIINLLGTTRVNGKPVRYELVCGADYRFMTQQMANYLYGCRFGYVGFDSKIHKNRIIRLAWDGSYSDQKKIKKAIDMLVKAGYKRNEIMLFMQANHSRSTFQECCLKLDLCKVWGVKVCDCYFDGQIGEHIIPIFWSGPEIKSFRHKVRKHNMLVNFGIDPEVN